MSRSSSPEPVTAVTDLAAAWLPARMAEVERRLGETVAGWGEELGRRRGGDADARAASGCARCSSCSAPGRGAGREAIRAATAIELVHMATLVHDDVLDAAPLRRGLPTVFASSGRRRAVAAGDLLFSRAFAILAADGDGPEPSDPPPTARSSCSPTLRSRSPAASSPSAATPTTRRSRSSATSSAAS